MRWWIGKRVCGTLWGACGGLDSFLEGFTDEVPVDVCPFGDEIGRKPRDCFEEGFRVVVEVIHRTSGVEELVFGNKDDADVDSFAH